MVESDSYGSDHFPIILKIGVSLPDALPRWNLNRSKLDYGCIVYGSARPSYIK